MNKGIHDIIRPQWIFDSITNNALALMSRKYFFHATPGRMESEEYNQNDDLEQRSLEWEPATRKFVSPGVHVDDQNPEPKEEDSEMQDWLQIEPSTKAARNDDNNDNDTDSATDPDSDNEDNWFSVEPPQSGGAEVPGMAVIFASLLGDCHTFSDHFHISSTQAMMSTRK